MFRISCITATLLLFALHGFTQRVNFSDGMNNGLVAFSSTHHRGFLRLNYDMPTNDNSHKVLLQLKSDTTYNYLLAVNNRKVDVDVIFEKPGNYRYVLSSANSILDSGTINVDLGLKSFFDDDGYYFGDDDTDTITDYYHDPASTMYYLNSKISFSTSLDANERPVSTYEEFLIDKNTGSYVYVFIENDSKRLACSEMIIDVYRKSGNQEELIETLHQPVDPRSYFTSFKYTFSKKGRYLFKVYTQDETWINTGDVTIRYE